jgi:hypothetical protein
MMSDPNGDRIVELEGRIAHLEAIQELLLRLMAITHPLSNVLAQFGANAAQEQEMMKLLDELAASAHSFERDNQPSFDHFQARVGEILPALRSDREFLRLLIDTLRVDRAAYRDLHEYMIAHDWVGRSYLRGVEAEIRNSSV